MIGRRSPSHFTCFRYPTAYSHLLYSDSMPVVRQRQWHAQSQQRAITDFRLARHACPPGMYLAVAPNDFTTWNGVLFVRKGPYLSAILRFQVLLPGRYPDVAPLVVFTSDVFHPLVTSLTTYTYTTGSSAADPVSATDVERLPPGGLSVRHRFHRWFEHAPQSPTSPVANGSVASPNGRNSIKRNSWDLPSPRTASKGHSRKFQSFHIPPPREDDDSTPSEPNYSIIEVLRYVKQVFEDEKCLDDLPLEAVGNPGAWHAWRAHRRKHLKMDKVESQQNTPQKPSNVSGRTRQGGGWNWDGVWADRAKKAIQASQSDATLFGNVDSEELIHFLDLDDEGIESAKRKVLDVAVK